MLFALAALTLAVPSTAQAQNATGAPGITGTAQVGETLTATQGTIADPDGITPGSGAWFSNATTTLQWIRVDGGSDSDISSATDRTYTLVTADEGKQVKVKVDFTDDDGHDESRTSDAYPADSTVLPADSVPSDWSLIPTGLSTGDKFRLLFLSSAKRNASSTDIADYNTFIQTRAAAGHTDIQDYSADFRAVGCTADTDARDNTKTTYTTTDKGVPIYWLNGAKAADEYEDFYDGSWDDEANDKNESGTNGLDTSQISNYPVTGCDHDGTENFTGSNLSRALGAAGGTKVGRPNSSNALHGPLSSNAVTGTANTRPMYGLSAVFQVAADTTPPTLTGANIDETDGLIINLDFSEDLQLSNPPPASAFTVTVDGSAATISSVLVPGSVLPQNELWLQLSTVITHQGQAVVVAYADPTTGDDANAIQDAAGNDADSFTTGLNGVPDVINNVFTKVPSNWSLIPTGLSTGARFRLLFLSSTKRDGSSSDIADYHAFIQTRAAAGHADIRTYSTGFRAVGCTADTDARDTTYTTYTSTDKGVPIYWLNGAKAADQYEDFYDGTWDDEVNDKNESGTNGPNTSLEANYPLTGCNDRGTEYFDRFNRSSALAKIEVMVGRPNSSAAASHGPLSSNTALDVSNTVTRPMYGLSAIFQVAADTTPPTLTSADVETTDALIINLVFSEDLQLSNPPPASAFTVTVDGSAATVSSVLVPESVLPQNEFWLQLSTAIRQGQAVVVTYTDPTAGNDTAAIQDTTGNDAADFTTGMNSVPAVINNSTVANAVLAGWSLTPTGLAVGDQFRLLFLSSTKRDATATDIATYNTFIQTRAAAGHADIQAYSAGFRALGCTSDVDARDNTETTYISTAKGVPIYWLNGAKAADQYEDFYDGSWDDEANDKNESGTDAHDTSQTANWPWTGCNHNGTEFRQFAGTVSRGLGSNNDVRYGRPDSSTVDHGPLNGLQNGPKAENRPLYGLSALFQVATTVVVNNPATGAPTITGTAQVGQTLTAATTAIMDTNGLTGVSYTYQWIRVATDNTETNISSATANTYTLVTDDLGTTIKVKVSFTDDASNPETLTSVATAVVSAAANTAPTVANAIPDQAATAGTAFSYVFPANTFSDADTGDTLSYTATKTDDTALPTWLAFAASTRTFSGTPQAADGGTVAVKVTASDGNGGSVSDTFDITVAADTTPPTLTSAGVNEAGLFILLGFSENLQLSNLPPASAFTVTAGGSAVTVGGVLPRPGAPDVFVITVSPAIRQGQAIVVTYTDPTAGDDATAFQDTAGNDAATFTTGSDNVPAVTNNSTVNTPATGAPAITGTAQVGQTLTAGTTAIMDADGLTSVSYTYQWIRTATGVDTNISGATASTYTLVAADLGTTIKVRVSFTDDASNAETLTSAATAAVSANNPPTSSNKNLALNEDTELTFFASDFPFTDADGNSLSSVKILSLPATDKGTLTFSGMALTSGDLPQTVPAAQFNSLKYVPPANENGGNIPFTSFTFRVNDGTDDSAATYTLTFLVYRVNDAATGQPGITGTAQVGQTLAATAGTIADVDGLPDPFLTDTNTSFQWVRVTSGTDADISGARDSTYTLVADDEGKKIKVKVSFLDTEASINQTEGPLTSAATATVSASTNTPATGAPTITGTAQVGQTLTATVGDIADVDGLPDPFLTDDNTSFQWLRVATDNSETDIGAMAGAYTLVADDLGKTIKVRVSFTDDASNDETLTSAATAAVAAATNTPATGAPTITGTAQVGQTLTATVGTIADANGLPDPFLADANTSFQWVQVDLGTETNIASATASTYTLVREDWAASVRVKVAFQDAQGNSEGPLTSSSVIIVKPANTAATGKPGITGTAQVGQTLTATVGTSADVDGLPNPFLTDVNTSFQWIRVATDNTETNIASATASTYTLVTDDAGTTIKVKVGFADNYDYDEMLTSDATAAVSAAANTPATGAPTITGTAQVGQTLTAGTTAIMDAEGLTTPSYTYQWIRVATDNSETNIASATASTYTLVDADLGTTVKVKVSFTDDASNAETLTSNVSVIIARPANTAATGKPGITGTAQVGQTLTATVGTSADVDGLPNPFLTDVNTSFQWIRVATDNTETNIASATASTYTLVAADLGTTIKVKVGFADYYDYDETLISDATAAVAASTNTPATGAPTITGTAQVGQTLTAGTTAIMDANGLTSVSYTYQWIRVDGGTETNISGATATTYTLVAADLGTTIKVTVSFTDDANNAETLTSDATAAVSAAANTLATGAPTITGTAQVGQTLTAGTTAIMDANGLTSVSYTYQWIRVDGGAETNISGATATTYTLVAADLGTTIKVTVSFTDDANNPEARTSAATAAVSAVVPSNWTLKPTALAAGAKFRLLFLSSTKRNATATDIATYNTFIQTRAAAGHTDIRAYSAGFRVVGCTAAVDARDNTKTTYTTTDKGVPIYWLNGAKAADQYEDFYDGSWDDEANDKNESGTNGLDTSLNDNWPLTGCDHDGTAEGALGASQVTVGRPNSSGSSHGPLNGNSQIASTVLTRPMYGLSAVFQVAAAVVTTVPGVPTGLTATASGTTAINLSWTAPGSTGGSAITGYKIEVSSDGGSSWSDLVANTSNTTTTYAHTGLAAGDTRHYRVSAINANGAGTASNVDSATTGTTVPGAPTGLTATASGSTAINLSWTAPGSTGGSAITGYKIEVSPNGTSGWTDQAADTNSTATTYAHTGLAAGDTRHYRVSAINTNGTGDPSNVDSATTDATVPDAPTGLTATASGATQIDLSWSAPGSTGGSAITGYKIEVSSDGGSSWSDLVANTSNTTTTYAHTGLTAGDTRHYRVSAINANGAGTASNVDSATTGTTVPGAPTGLTATASGSTAINLSWTAPGSTGGSAITGYKIEVSPNGTSGWTDQAADTNSTATTYAHTGLAAGDTRHYRVSAINTNGTGDPSNVDSATTDATVPDAPTGLTATASGATAINLSWTAPGSTGGSAITGYKIEVSSNGGSSWTNLVANTGNATTTYAHTGLTAGTTRHYRVSAINANGAGTASNVANATTGQTTVTFEAASYTAAEGGAAATVAVQMSAAPSATVAIPLTKTHRGGATAADYSGVPSNVTFTAGQTRRTFTVTATDDSDKDGGESVQLGFGTLPGGYAPGARRTATVTLVDDDANLIVNFGTERHTTVKVRESDVWHRFIFMLSTSRYGPPNGNPQQPVTIPLAVTHRGTASQADYTDIPASVTFGVGESVTFFRMRAIPDRKKEIGEGLRLDFGPLPAGVRAGTWGPYETIEFLDEYLPDLTVRFGASSYTAAEGGADARVSIHLSEKVDVEPLVVRLSAQPGGGATPGDYSVPSSVTFAVGEQTKTIAVAAVDDTDDDDGESVTLSFVNAPNDRLITDNRPSTATVALEDNDGAGKVEVSFGAATYTATEGGSGATVRVQLDAAPGRAVTVPLTAAGAGGATAADYSGIPANVTFGANQTSMTLTVTATDDTVPDGGESVRIAFGALPQGVLAGRPAATVVTLKDGTERELVVQFDTHWGYAVEAREGGVRLRLRLLLNKSTTRPLTIPLAVTHRGGATAADYAELAQSVTIPEGAKEAPYYVRALPDGEAETGEGLRIDFGPLPPGVTKGAWGPYETIDFVDADPTPSSLRVSGSLLTLGYPGALDGGSTPSGGDFVVLAGPPGGEAVVPVTSVSVEGESVLLRLARPVTADETVTLTYLTAAMHPIRDAAGVAAAPLADEPVRNETGVSGFPAEPGRAAGTGIPAPLAAVLEAAQVGGVTERLDLSSRNLTDVSALAGLSGVRELDLRDNAIADLSPLAGLTGLQVLNLAGNRIEELWPLSGLTGLEVLNLSGNRIADIATLAGLSGLEVLNLAGNRIVEPWPLAGLTGLRRLNLSGNGIADIATLERLSGLQVLDLAGNRIVEPWPLAGLTVLQRLNLSDNGIGDIATLAGLGGLQVLLLDGNRVADVGALSPLAGLENLGLSDNRIADIGPLAQLGRLRRLDLSGNAVADISALGDVSGLLWLRLPGNPVSDAVPLGRLERLRWLWLDPATAAGLEAWAPPAGRGPARLWIERVPAQ